jgi:3-hydroxyacyl-[acyl-carrier-protein] dehydratase
MVQQMLVSRENVLTFIPQREPIVMVHGLLEHGPKISKALFTVEEGNLFVRDGRLLPSGLMEHIAQSAAIRSGYAFSQMPMGEGPAKPPVGFIAALKDFEVHALPMVGDALHTTITELNVIGNMTVVQGEVFRGDMLVASCEMKVFLSDAEQ